MKNLEHHMPLCLSKFIIQARKAIAFHAMGDELRNAFLNPETLNAASHYFSDEEYVDFYWQRLRYIAVMAFLYVDFCENNLDLAGQTFKFICPQFLVAHRDSWSENPLCTDVYPAKSEEYVLEYKVSNK